MFSTDKLIIKSFTPAYSECSKLPCFSKLPVYQYVILVYFGRACAPLRCAHPSFWAHCYAQRGAARPPPSQLRCFLFAPQSLSSGQNRATRGVYLSIGLSCTLLSYIASYWATLHSPELRCTLMSYTAPEWATLHPNELHCTLFRYPLSYDAYNWAKLLPI